MALVWLNRRLIGTNKRITTLRASFFRLSVVEEVRTTGMISVIITSLNEGDNLKRTVGSILGASGELDIEIVVVDDGSTDGSVERTAAQFSDVYVVRHDCALGVSASRVDGVTHAAGDILMFFDAHVKPDAGCLQILAEGVRGSEGEAILIPTIFQLDPVSWSFDRNYEGHGVEMRLDTFSTRWVRARELVQTQLNGRKVYKSPNLAGCSLALHRVAYEHIMGFDAGMRTWGMEDLDFGIRAWMTGHPILFDGDAKVAHRFVNSFDVFAVRGTDFLYNQMRMARKIFSDITWEEWIRDRVHMYLAKPDVCDSIREAAALFLSEREDLERKRKELIRRRVHDEYWYAKQFGLGWPDPRVERVDHMICPVQDCLCGVLS